MNSNEIENTYVVTQMSNATQPLDLKYQVIKTREYTYLGFLYLKSNLSLQAIYNPCQSLKI